MTEATCSKCIDELNEDEEQDALLLSALVDVDHCVGCVMLEIREAMQSYDDKVQETVH